jgi:hypothetical protein
VFNLAKQDLQVALFAGLDRAGFVPDVNVSQLTNLLGLPTRDILSDPLAQFLDRVEPPDGEPRLNLADLIQKCL